MLSVSFFVICFCHVLAFFVLLFFFFFFNDTATTEIYTLSLHDALPISLRERGDEPHVPSVGTHREGRRDVAAIDVTAAGDRKSTRLNSSHTVISYAVFCLKKKKNKKKANNMQVQNATDKFNNTRIEHSV